MTINKKKAAFAAVTVAVGLAAGASTSSAAAQCGRASWYALHSKTASGERMNPSALTAAHRSLPFGTRLKVTNKNNGKSVVVRINDRGPFIKGRVLDLSRGAASQLGFVSSGHAAVCMARVCSGHCLTAKETAPPRSGAFSLIRPMARRPLFSRPSSVFAPAPIAGWASRPAFSKALA